MVVCIKEKLNFDPFMLVVGRFTAETAHTGPESLGDLGSTAVAALPFRSLLDNFDPLMLVISCFSAKTSGRWAQTLRHLRCAALRTLPFYTCHSNLRRLAFDFRSSVFWFAATASGTKITGIYRTASAGPRVSFHLYLRCTVFFSFIGRSKNPSTNQKNNAGKANDSGNIEEPGEKRVD